MKKVPPLKQSSMKKVSEILLELIRETNCDDTIKEYCCVLKSIGSFEVVAATVLDIQAQVMYEYNNSLLIYVFCQLFKLDNNEELWKKLYSLLIEEKTTKLRIKPGWFVGEVLIRKLQELRNLHTIDITGITLY